jgi:hypothetical protein
MLSSWLLLQVTGFHRISEEPYTFQHKVACLAKEREKAVIHQPSSPVAKGGLADVDSLIILSCVCHGLVGLLHVVSGHTSIRDTAQG